MHRVRRSEALQEEEEKKKKRRTILQGRDDEPTAARLPGKHRVGEPPEHRGGRIERHPLAYPRPVVRQRLHRPVRRTAYRP